MKLPFKRLLGQEAFFYAFFVKAILNSVWFFKKSIIQIILLGKKLNSPLHQKMCKPQFNYNHNEKI